MEMKLENLQQFLDECSGTALRYRQRKQIIVPEKCNIFPIISDLYYRENLHSDLLAYFFKQDASHGAGNKFLFVFLELLKNINPSVVFNNPQRLSVFRERGRVDIAICNEEQKQVILIENKINGATDQPFQLVRYYQGFIQKGYDVLAIVYLSLDGGKRPSNFSGWTDEEKRKIADKLICLAAYNEGLTDLYKHWLIPCMQQVSDPDVLSLLRQYGHLLQLLNKNSMDYQNIDAFYEIIRIDQEKYKTALSIRNMIGDLPHFLAEHILHEHDHCKVVFPHLWIYKDEEFPMAVFQDCMLADNFNLTIDVEVQFESIEITVFERMGNLSVGNNDLIHPLLQMVKEGDKFIYDPARNRYVNKYLLPEDKQGVDEFINDLTEEIKRIKNI